MGSETQLSDYSGEIAKGSFWGVAGNILVKLTSFVYIILIARVASQNDIGLFYLALSVLSIPGIVDDLGLPAALNRYIPYFEGRNEKNRIRGLLNISYIAVAFSGIFFGAFLFWQADNIGAIYHSVHLADAIKYLSSFLVLNNLLSISTNFLQGRANIRSAQLLNNLQNLLKLVFTAVLFYFYGPSVFTLCLAFVASYLVAALLSFFYSYGDIKNFPKEELPVDLKQLAFEIIPFGLALGVIASLSTVFQSSDKLVLGYLTDPLHSSQTVAIYSLAINLSSLLIIFSGGIGSIFFSIISRMVGKNENSQMKIMMETGSRWILFVMAPISIVFILFSSEMISFIYGKAYESGGPSLSIFTIGFFIGSLYYVVSYALAAVRKIKIEFLVIVVGGTMNLILDFLLIPIYGMQGGAMASLMSYAGISLMLAYFGKKYFGFTLPRESIRILIAGILAFALLYLSKSYLLPLSLLIVPKGDSSGYVFKIFYLLFISALTAISTILFIAFALLLKCFKREDVILLKRGLARIKTPMALIDWSDKLLSFGVS